MFSHCRTCTNISSKYLPSSFHNTWYTVLWHKAETNRTTQDSGMKTIYTNHLPNYVPVKFVLFFIFHLCDTNSRFRFKSTCNKNVFKLEFMPHFSEKLSNTVTNSVTFCFVHIVAYSQLLIIVIVAP